MTLMRMRPSAGYRYRGGSAAPPPPPPPSGAFYGVAELPRRQAAFSGPLPDRLAASPSHVFRVTGSNPTWAQYAQAFADAFAAPNTEPKWIVLPGTAVIDPPMSTGYIVPPRPTGTQHPVIVCSNAWFDGLVTLTPNVRIALGHEETQPKIRTCRINSNPDSDSTPHIHQLGTVPIVYIDVCLETTTANSGGFDRALGYSGYSDMVQDNTFRNRFVAPLAFRWCTTRMSSFFRPDNGQWRNGMQWAFFNDGADFCFMDGRHFGHGALGSQGSDRGFISGTQSSGGWTITNNEIRDPGGIGFLHGGWIRDAATAPDECADVTIRYNYVWRTPDLKPTGLGALRDSANATCPWGSKNIFEIKTGRRWDVRHNLLLGDWTLGQAQAVVLKSVWQGAKDLVETTADVVFAENIVTTDGKCAFSLSLVEADYVSFTEVQRGTGRVRAGERWEIANNLMVTVNNIPSGWMAQISVRTDIPAGWSEGEADEIAFRGNTMLMVDTPAGVEKYIRGIGFSTRDTAGLRINRLTFAGNAVGPEHDAQTYTWLLAETGPGGASVAGLDSLADSPAFFPNVTVGVNARIGTSFAYGDGSAPTQLDLASLAAAGLTRGATPDQWTLSPSSPLRTGGPGGTRIGADIDALAAMRTDVLAGVVP